MKLIIVIFILVFIIFSGCISPDKNFFTRPTPLLPSPAMTPIITPSAPPTVTPSLPSGDTYWIRIDPISDIENDTAYNIIGSTLLTVRGTTNYQDGTMLHFAILEERGEREVLRTNIRVWSNDRRPNSFAFAYDMKGNPPGQYQLVITDPKNGTEIISSFNITSILSHSIWIRMDPIGEVHKGQKIQVSGTTDLPPGNWIKIESRMGFHSCYTPSTPDPYGKRSLCGGGCYDTETIHQTAQVIEGNASVNTWNTTVEIGDWCTTENYNLIASAIGWNNVTAGGQAIRFS